MRSPVVSGLLCIICLGGGLGQSALWANPPLPSGAVARLNGGSNPFLCMASSPDGKLLASGGYERTIHLWDLATAKELRHWEGPEPNVTSIAFSPDGGSLATGGVRDTTVHLWEVATGRELRQFKGLPRGASSLAFSPDGGLLAAGASGTGDVFVWEAASGKSISRLSGPPQSPPDVNVVVMRPDKPPPEFSHVAFSPDGKTLASGHTQGLIRIWDTATFHELRHFRGPPSDAFVHVNFSPDSQVLAGWGSVIRLWQPENGKQFRFFGEQPALRIGCVAFSRDCRTLASGSYARDSGDNAVHLWEIATGLERCRLEGHQYAISAVVFPPGGTTLVTGSLDGTGFIWDLRKLPQSQLGKARPGEKDLNEHWRSLAGHSAARAYQAIQAMVHAPQQSSAFLKTRLQPTFAASARRIGQLLAALDSNHFQERETATDELAVQVEVAEGALRQARSGHLSAEARARLDRVLGLSERAGYSAGQLQTVRALEVLENTPTDESKELLQRIAGGDPGFRITRAARAALARQNVASDSHLSTGFPNSNAADRLIR